MATSGKTITIDTGNIFDLDLIQSNNTIFQSSDEVLQGIECMLKAFCGEKFEANNVQIQDRNVTHIASGKELTEGNERNKLKLTVKLFLYPDCCSTENGDQGLNDVIDESIASIVQLLDVGYVDNLIISVQEQQEDRVMPFLKSVWLACENHTKSSDGHIGQVRSLGTSDLNRDQLKELFQLSNAKPKSSQINLDACCDIPEDLAAFAKDNSIKLLTHNDPLYDFVPIERIRAMFDKLKTENVNCKLLRQIIPDGVESDQLHRRWVARYTLVLSNQGVLLAKGYLVSLFLSNNH
ncbi:hypothetical protein RDWZM_000928 [Blomia tropicalis]|uniref:GCS light chain n=1 Tax=Blomia tropicalis TaxID=40697 RepID=A0A9Q0RNG4_BLOTA|nr:hypothetical protein BLOT_015209 [Blomia tropicalis]KAJ6222383.1 hypothetical protein RDWZM_000928 [Blomia tropicalis]